MTSPIGSVAAAQLLAIDEPQRVRGLVLVGSPITLRDKPGRSGADGLDDLGADRSGRPSRDRRFATCGVPRAAHTLAWEEPARLAADLMAFVASLGD